MILTSYRPVVVEPTGGRSQTMHGLRLHVERRLTDRLGGEDRLLAVTARRAGSSTSPSAWRRSQHRRQRLASERSSDPFVLSAGRTRTARLRRQSRAARLRGLEGRVEVPVTVAIGARTSSGWLGVCPKTVERSGRFWRHDGHRLLVVGRVPPWRVRHARSRSTSISTSGIITVPKTNVRHAAASADSPRADRPVGSLSSAECGKSVYGGAGLSDAVHSPSTAAAADDQTVSGRCSSVAATEAGVEVSAHSFRRALASEHTATLVVVWISSRWHRGPLSTGERDVGPVSNTSKWRLPMTNVMRRAASMGHSSRAATVAETTHTRRHTPRNPKQIENNWKEIMFTRSRRHHRIAALLSVTAVSAVALGSAMTAAAAADDDTVPLRSSRRRSCRRQHRRDPTPRRRRNARRRGARRRGARVEAPVVNAVVEAPRRRGARREVRHRRRGDRRDARRSMVEPRRRDGGAVYTTDVRRRRRQQEPLRVQGRRLGSTADRPAATARRRTTCKVTAPGGRGVLGVAAQGRRSTWRPTSITGLAIVSQTNPATPTPPTKAASTRCG